jgi:hypothetical protein
MKRQKGSILIFSIIMMTVILMTSVALARIFAPKIRTINDAVNAVVAIFAADSAVELCLYEARKGFPASLIMTNGATYKIASLSAAEVDITADCTGLGEYSFKFRATGTFRGTNRALEISQ